ncbi:MAG: PD40 domain-containing protein, partial [Planctomycetaceae bacterium]|nr:PD40 domain-containing protein [Planctomycetaceae bacterium]
MYINATGISWSRTEPVIAVQDHFCQRIVDYSNGENNVWDYDNAIEDRLAPTFSPDGQSVAFADVRSDRFVIRSREGHILHEFEGGEYHSFPHWSPDGRWIVWKSLKGENVRLNIVDLSAASPVSVTIPLTLHFLFAVTISPDSRFVAYIDHTDNERRAERLHVYELSTGQQNHSEITWNRHFGFAPVWSQDSSQIYAGQLFSVGQNSELKLVSDLNRASYVQFAEFTSAGRILLGGAEFTKGDPFAFHLLEATGADLATKVISTRINPLLQPPCARIRRHEDHAIVIAQHDMLGLGHSLAMLNVETGEFQWNGIAFSDGKTLALTPGGDILHGPEDIDRYIVQSIRYPGGRTVPATRKQLLERLSETDQQAAVRWATDHGARMVTEDGAESDPEGTSQPASTALPKAASISELDFSGSKELVPEELAHLAAFENLSVLDLSSTNLPELPPLDTLKHLTDLNLSHSSVTSIAGVRECVSLLALNLSHTPIDPVAVESIRELKNLTRLNLNHTRIDRFALAELASLHSLKELHLEGVEVPTENINQLK